MTQKTWHPVWEDIFAARSSWGKYPPEELVRFMAWNYYSAPDRAKIRVLEVGCGPGGGPSWFVAREGFRLSGIDGSPTAIDKAKARFRGENLTAEFVVGDLASLPWPDASFDAVIDIACLQCNSEADTAIILKEVFRVMKPGARHFSLTSRAGCWGDGSGEVVDATSYRDVRDGPFAAMGVIRFATAESLRNLYAAFKDLNLEYSLRSMQNGTVEVANWIVTCSR